MNLIINIKYMYDLKEMPVTSVTEMRKSAHKQRMFLVYICIYKYVKLLVA